MGRIEDAIEKARQRGAEQGRAAAVRAPIARVTDSASVSSEARAYGGRHVEVDFDALRAQGLIAPGSQEKRLADEYRVIKRPLIRNAREDREPLLERGNLLMVGSAIAGEGKTFTCVNLCLSIAREKDWDVLLIDGDCAKPHLTQLFGAAEQPGLMELLRDPELAAEQLVMPTNVPGLSLLPAGSPDDSAAELLASDRMDAVCAHLSSSDPGRIVVFDSSPLLYTTEAPVLALQVGQVVIVVQAGRTPQQAVLAAVEKIDQTKATSLVLNQAAEGGAAGYGYGYGYGSYGYGAGAASSPARHEPAS